MRRSFQSGVRKNNFFSRAYKYVDALVNAAWMDFYGVTEFDVLITGPDRLVNMVLAYRAAAAGNKVGLYHGKRSSWQDAEKGLNQRLEYFDPSFARLIEVSLGLKNLGNSYYAVLQNLGFHLDSLLDAEGQPMVFQLDGCKLLHDNLEIDGGGNGCHFWLEPDPEKHVYPGIERLIFWPESYAARFATEEGKCPEHRLVAKDIWMTGTPINEMADLPGVSKRFGDAMIPFRSFTHFTGNDRLYDISESLRAF